jgi:hypothetical protein
MNGGALSVIGCASLGFALGCAPLPSVCSAKASCGSGRICVTGRCTRPGTQPVAPDSYRIVVAASDLAVVSARSQDETLPTDVALAAPSAPIVLLRFPAPWGNRARIAAAFLTLHPEEAAVGDGGRPWTVSVARVLEPWSGASVSWGRLPRLSAPLVTTEVPLGSSRPLRIDVTSIVQRWSLAEDDEQGIALWASSAGWLGPTYATGALGLAGPRLDVYVR